MFHFSNKGDLSLQSRGNSGIIGPQITGTGTGAGALMPSGPKDETPTQLKLKRCERGHFYDATRFSTCPYDSPANIESDKLSSTRTRQRSVSYLLERLPDNFWFALAIAILLIAVFALDRLTFHLFHFLLPFRYVHFAKWLALFIAILLPAAVIWRNRWRFFLYKMYKRERSGRNRDLANNAEEHSYRAEQEYSYRESEPIQKSPRVAGSGIGRSRPEARPSATEPSREEERSKKSIPLAAVHTETAVPHISRTASEPIEKPQASREDNLKPKDTPAPTMPKTASDAATTPRDEITPGPPRRPRLEPPQEPPRPDQEESTPVPPVDKPTPVSDKTGTPTKSEQPPSDRPRVFTEMPQRQPAQSPTEALPATGRPPQPVTKILKRDLPASEPSARAEYVNFSFFDTTDEPFRRLSKEEGLHCNLTYKFIVSIGLEPDERYEAEVSQSKISRPKDAPPSITLDVALVLPNQNIQLETHWATIDWPEYGPSQNNAEFTLKALSSGVGRIKVLVYFEHDLLFSGDMAMDIAEEGDGWDRAQPIRWASLNLRQLSLFRNADALDMARKRKLNISVYKDSDYSYVFVFFIRGSTGSAAAYPLTVEFSEDEIASYLARIRSTFRLLIDDPQFATFHRGLTNYTGQYRLGDSGVPADEAIARSRIQSALKVLAEVGHELWRKMFSSETGRRMEGFLREELSHDGVIVQVWTDPDARDLVLPWVWLYPQDCEEQIDVTKFWGYRYVIEQIRRRLGTTRPIDTVPIESFRISSALHNFPTRQAQKDFFESCKSNFDPAFGWLNIKPVDCRSYLRECDAHVLYFYCHGHTAENTLNSFYQTMRSIADLAKQQDQSELLECMARQMRDRVRDRSYIQIENTTLRLGDINEFFPKKNTWPLVFLNLCESAEFYPGMTDNLVDAFLDRNAGGVIGTEMPMLTLFGDLMGRKFFDYYFNPTSEPDKAVFEGQGVGHVLWKLRREFLDQGNPLAFAYTYFGDATTRLKPAFRRKNTNSTIQGEP